MDIQINTTSKSNNKKPLYKGRKLPPWLWLHRHTLLFISIILLLSAATAFHRIYNTDFYPMNGDFQNYNVYRRILSGQTPYVDFANYLGTGVIAINVPFLFFRNDFAFSVFVTNFSTFSLFCLSIFLFLRASNISRITAYCISSLAPMAILLIPQVQRFTPYVYMPGNSMRMTRTFLPFGLAAIALLWKHYKRYSDADLLNLLSDKNRLAIAGAITGLTFTWSNDFGLSCLIASALFVFSIQIFWSKASTKAVFLRTAYFSAAAILGAIASMAIATKGHPVAFLKATQGIAQYQFWYYYNPKILKVSDFRVIGYLFRAFVVINIWLTTSSFIQMHRKKSQNIQFLAAFISNSMLIAVLLYALGSGGTLDSAIQHLVFLFALTLIAKSADLVHNTNRPTASALPTGILLTLFFISITAATIEFYHQRNRNDLSVVKTIEDWHAPEKLFLPNLNNYAPYKAVYTPELGGFTHYGNSLKQAQMIIGEAAIFSTYSTALEVMLGQKQPTGYDYIIHVLGDSARQRYLDKFLREPPPIAQTIREDFSAFEPWAQRENWFFYRELYANYEPMALTEYSVLWKRSPRSNLISNNCTASIGKDQPHSTTVISIRCSDSLSGIADIDISYHSQRTRTLSNLLTIRTLVYVSDSSMIRYAKDSPSEYFLPNVSKSTALPVLIRNGVGSVAFGVRPLDAAAFYIQGVKVNAVLPDFPRKAMELRGQNKFSVKH